jgi:hypothetical protein
MTRPGSLSFVLNFKTTEFTSLDLPVEVRKPNLALVARTLSSQSVEVEPGPYYVTATLPAGQELTQTVEVAEGEHASVELSPDTCDESPHELHEFAHFFLNRETVAPSVWPKLEAGMPGATERGLESLGGTAVAEGKLRLFSGNAVLDQLQPRNDLLPQHTYTMDGLTQFEIYGVEAPLMAQLLQPNAPPLNVGLPAAPNTSCTIVLSRQPDNTHTLDVQLEHRVADLLLHYREQGRFSQAVTALDSQAMNAKTLLRQKKRDPLAAAVGAYGILRFGQLEQLHDWTKNLWQWFPWLPDGAAIWGEHLARLGRHDEALAVFLELPKRGLPFFSEGLSYAIDRLRVYESLGVKESATETVARATLALEQLQRFIPYADFGRPILTYTGLDPTRPDDSPLDDFVPVDNGLDLATLV